MFPGNGPQRRIARCDSSNMVNDAISDLLVQIKNGYMAKNATVELPWSKLKEAVVKVMADNNFVGGYEVIDDRSLVIKLKYEGKKPVLTDVKRVSKPSLRVYAGKGNLPKVLGGLGILIVSTPMGLMTGKDAYKKGIGGEVICKIW